MNFFINYKYLNVFHRIILINLQHYEIACVFVRDEDRYASEASVVRVGLSEIHVKDALRRNADAGAGIASYRTTWLEKDTKTSSSIIYYSLVIKLIYSFIITGVSLLLGGEILRYILDALSGADICKEHAVGHDVILSYRPRSSPIGLDLEIP